MRDIKFRGKRKDNGEWVYGYYYTEITGFHLSQGSMPGVDGTPMVAHYIKDFDGDDFEVDPKTVGQFAGLKDKAGREIYEGDMLKTSEPYEGNLREVVFFGNGSFRVKCLSDSSKVDYPLGSIATKFIEVLGSIHSNPDLLKCAPS